MTKVTIKSTITLYTSIEVNAKPGIEACKKAEKQFNAFSEYLRIDFFGSSDTAKELSGNSCFDIESVESSAEVD
jgi:hypothetical protein